MCNSVGDSLGALVGVFSLKVGLPLGGKVGNALVFEVGELLGPVLCSPPGTELGLTFGVVLG